MAKRFLVMCIVFMFIAGMVFAAGKGETSSDKDDFPNRPIRLILPVNPGGGMETTARQWQKYFEKELGVPLVFESQAGAGTLIGNRAVANAEPDGYTLGLFSSPDFDFTILTMDAPYKADDFYWISGYYSDRDMVWVHKDSPWNTLKEFTDYVKTQPPRSIPVSVSTQTSIQFINFKNLENVAGVEFNIVAFTGGNPARLAVASKEVAATIVGLSGGRMIADSCKIIGVMAKENRYANQIGNVKTAIETYGIEYREALGIYGLFAPGGLAQKYPERAKFIAEAFHAAITNPDYIADLTKLGVELTAIDMDPETTQKHIENNLQILKQYTNYFK
jgi:tripartite-type tricarboxylate transporter receptor subunit TctC